MALLSFGVSSYQPWTQRSREQSDDWSANEPRRKPWSAYGLLCLVLVFILAPQPSILLVCLKYYHATTQPRLELLGHLSASYFLLFTMLSSLLVTLVRDPGKVKPLEELENQENQNDFSREDQVGEDNEDISLADALLEREPGDTTDSFSLTPVKRNGESRWCRKCWAPKPERTHHCSECNRCVLKMDHHCPWLANRCVGARTYPAFLHFLLTATIYSAYICFLAIPLIQYYVDKPFVLDDTDMIPYHTMTVALLGGFFSFTIGSFFIYHVYLTLTNQTTLESLAPMLLLQYLPDIPAEPTQIPIDDVQPPPFTSQPPSPTNISMTSLHRSHSPPPYAPPPSGTRRSQMFAEPYRFPSPPPLAPRRFQDHELNRRQRQLIRDAHSRIRIYDLGWKNNVLDVLGGPMIAPGKPKPPRLRAWAERIFWGGKGRGDGHTFRHNPRAEDQLRTLANDLLAAATSS